MTGLIVAVVAMINIFLAIPALSLCFLQSW